ncbi:hypothetical protein [Streptomyces hilarionis]|uniref:hypothetical protein n=1 Tax=Streptomyces hilarionis TaxID=2839954 RepID=UPI002119D673|nr:hypothetical protein [Streptomyces hilarionis]MCQ9134587.1 hypothetical protein [Streptomyces hilarionis]
MSLTCRSLMETVAACFGWRRAYGDTAQVDALLAEQSEAAYNAAADHTALATAKNTNALHVQPGVLDARSRILAHVLYLEGVLAGARNRGLPSEVIEHLEDAVDHGHELTVLLADAVRSTTAAHTHSSS